MRTSENVVYCRDCRELSEWKRVVTDYPRPAYVTLGCGHLISLTDWVDQDQMLKGFSPVE